MQDYEEPDHEGDVLEGLRNALILTLAPIAVAMAFGKVLSDGDDAAVLARVEADVAARKALKPCDVTIAQYGPGERWLNPPPSSCGGALGAVPNNVLSTPVAAK